MENATSAPAGHESFNARVLIVDDDPALRLVCSAGLQAAGHDVLEAADGRRGLALARAAHPDLVLTDVAMPQLDGFQLAAALRAHEDTREIPLIFLSGETAASDRARAEELGALAYVTKPFDPTTLAALVADALARVARCKREAAPRSQLAEA